MCAANTKKESPPKSAQTSGRASRVRSGELDSSGADAVIETPSFLGTSKIAGKLRRRIRSEQENRSERSDKARPSFSRSERSARWTQSQLGPAVRPPLSPLGTNSVLREPLHPPRQRASRYRRQCGCAHPLPPRPESALCIRLPSSILRRGQKYPPACR